MSIKEFLAALNQGREFSEAVFCFSGTAYSALFFASIVPLLARRLQLNLEYIEVDEPATLMARLATLSISGNSFFWLGNSADCEASAAGIMQALSAGDGYQGPHRVALFIESKKEKSSLKGKSVVHISCDDEIDNSVLKLFGDLVHGSQEKWSLPRPNIALKGTRLTLDGACTIMRYQAFGDALWGAVEQRWLSRLLPGDQSLFTLAQAFLAQNEDQFVACWWDVGPLYPPEFWLVFWSELLWQAWIVITFARASSAPVDRRWTYRLPFSFLQRDWKRYQPRELVVAHNALYGADYALKCGGNECALELVLWHFIRGNYKGTRS